jgi:predicted dehydrogenase
MRVRVGVIGGGHVAQAMHLPNLSALTDRFSITALAEPSLLVRTALSARYGIDRTYEDYRDLLASRAVDAVVIATPHGTHAEIVLAALEAGCHVLVEKPMCITLADADKIVEARDRTGLVVQIATMKRYDPAYLQMLAELPESTEGLRYISVVVHDPEVAPYFAPWEIIRGTDVDRDTLQSAAAQEAAQVAEAVGSDDPEAVWAFSYAFLGSLLHDVNVVNGLLARMGEPLPAEVISGGWWANGTAVSGAARLANGTRWDSAHVPLLGAAEYKETISLFFADSIRTLVFPSPWLAKFPTVYRRSEAAGRAASVTTFEMHEESFVRELEHFHSCITTDASCMTPPEQARTDLELLTAMFKAAPETSRALASAEPGIAATTVTA